VSGAAGQDLATSLQARQSLLQCGNRLIRRRGRSSMLFQECRLLALQGDLGFKVRNPENELGKLVGYRSDISLPKLNQ
jgi:hypothetical protein